MRNEGSKGKKWRKEQKKSNKKKFDQVNQAEQKYVHNSLQIDIWSNISPCDASGTGEPDLICILK
jgi:hypothetical protein